MVVTASTLSLSCSICTMVGPVAAVFVLCKQLSLLSLHCGDVTLCHCLVVFIA